MTKGDPDCRCECCVYWRRHVHRVAANGERRGASWRKQAEKWKNYYLLADENARMEWRRVCDLGLRLKELKDELKATKSLWGRIFG